MNYFQFMLKDEVMA